MRQKPVLDTLARIVNDVAILLEQQENPTVKAILDDLHRAAFAAYQVAGKEIIGT